MNGLSDFDFERWTHVWWLNALMIFALSSGFYLTLLLIRNGARRALPKLMGPVSNRAQDFLAGVLSRTRRFFLFSLSVYLVVQMEPFLIQREWLIHRIFWIVMMFQMFGWVTFAIDYWVTNFFRVSLASSDAQSASSLGLISFAARAIAIVTIVLVTLSNLGVDITALITGLGIGGIAVALALQNVLGDLFASLTIVLDKPFIVGDFIEVDQLRGKIEHIGLKTTRIRSLSGEQLIFSNGDLLKSRIRNFKRMSERRVAQNISVTYDTAEGQLREIPHVIQNIVDSQNHSSERVRFERCHFLDFQDSSLRYELVYWVLSSEYLDYVEVAQEINIQIHQAFVRLSIDFAYSTRNMIQKNQTAANDVSAV